MIALGELRIPPKIDCLYVEQEVVADDTRAVDAVLKADGDRWALLEEEKLLLSQMASGSTDVALDERYIMYTNPHYINVYVTFLSNPIYRYIYQ